ncbi:MAG: hypothetical protein Q8L24_03060 [bacterium]|nr:hypothetical protein [bacterium]
MAEGLPANTNPFVVLISWSDKDSRLHEIAPEYFCYNEEAAMPIAKKVVRPPLSQKEAMALVRSVVRKDVCVQFAVHERFIHIIPADLKKVVRVVRPYSASHGKNEFYIPCCTESESYFIK